MSDVIVDLKGGALAVATKNIPWPEGKAKRSSVNSSGYGGANGHVVIDGVDEYFKSMGLSNPYNMAPEVNPYSTILQKKFLLPVMGHDEYSMRRSLEIVTSVLGSQTHDLHELLYTMIARRTRFSHRAMIPVEISDEKRLTTGDPVTGRTNNSVPVIAFVFTGQGAQWAEMGRRLLDCYPSVRKTFKNLNLALSHLEQRPTWTLEGTLTCERSSLRIMVY
jgi:acyl transferase domain-containing protein